MPVARDVMAAAAGAPAASEHSRVARLRSRRITTLDMLKRKEGDKENIHVCDAPI